MGDVQGDGTSKVVGGPRQSRLEKMKRKEKE
jgi:hypothetical protein